MTTVPGPTPRVVRFGVFTFDRVTGELWKQGRRIKLQDQPRQVLAMLVERPGELITREELCSALWRDDTFVDFDTGLNVVINKTRQALDDSAATPRFIETLPRRGYRFLAPVVAETDSVSNTVKPVDPPRVSTVWLSSVALVALLMLGGYAFTTIRSRVPALPASAFEGAKVQRLTGSGNAGRAVAMSRDGSWVAYTVIEPKGEGLWVRQVNANTSVPIVPPAIGRFGGLNFSPDGSFVYYTFSTFSPPPSQLYRVPVLGGPPTKLAVADIDTVVAFSPDGQRMAFGRSRSDIATTMIYVSDLDGSQPHLLAERKDPNRFFLPPQGGVRLAWSPDGKSIAVPIVEPSPDTGIGIITVATGEVTTLGDARWSSLNALEWLPDGRGLLAAGNEKGGQSLSSQIWQVDYPGGARRQITHDLNDYFGISLTADGRTFAATGAEYFSTLWIASVPSLAQPTQITIAGKHDEGANGLSWTLDDRLIYTSTESGNLDLWERDVQSGATRQLTTDSASDYLPAVSPDGATVAFVSNRSGQPRIWVMDRDGTNARALSKGPNDILLTWGADGSYVVFERRFGGGGEGVPLIAKYPGAEEQPFVARAAVEGAAARAFNPRSISRQGLIAGYTRGPRGREITIVSPAGTTLRSFDSPGSNGRPLIWTPDGLAVTAVNPQHDSNVLSYPAGGGAPTRLTNFPDGVTHRIAWSRDGKRLAMSRGHDRIDVVLFTPAGK